jgi:hypothetical protein
MVTAKPLGSLQERCTTAALVPVIPYVMLSASTTSKGVYGRCPFSAAPSAGTPDGTRRRDAGLLPRRFRSSLAPLPAVRVDLPSDTPGRSVRTPDRANADANNASGRRWTDVDRDHANTRPNRPGCKQWTPVDNPRLTRNVSLEDNCQIEM